jgi:hypothetical protein
MFGMLGLVLGAQLTSAGIHISGDLANPRAAAAAHAEAAGAPSHPLTRVNPER